MSASRVEHTLRVGGVVAVGFSDCRHLLIGTHSGLGIFDLVAGSEVDRVPDVAGTYFWFEDDPPSASYAGVAVPVAGLWGGQLGQSTNDGWTYEVHRGGTRLLGPDGVEVSIDDAEELRAVGFSADGRTFVFASSSTVHVAIRR